MIKKFGHILLHFPALLVVGCTALNSVSKTEQVEAIKAFGLRGDRWSQLLGFALFMAIDRLSDNWKMDAFGDGNRNVLTLLDDALVIK